MPCHQCFTLQLTSANFHCFLASQCTHGWCTPDTFAQLSRVTRLALQGSRSPAGQGPTTADFSALPLLRELSLAGERLAALPAGVAGLQQLSVLDLTDNRLASLPAGPYLSGLRHLSLAGNSMTALPAVLEAATGLEVLDLTGCLALEDLAVLNAVRDSPEPGPSHLHLTCSSATYNSLPYLSLPPRLQMPSLYGLYYSLELNWDCNEYDYESVMSIMSNELSSMEVRAVRCGMQPVHASVGQ